MQQSELAFFLQGAAKWQTTRKTISPLTLKEKSAGLQFENMFAEWQTRPGTTAVGDGWWVGRVPDLSPILPQQSKNGTLHFKTYLKMKARPVRLRFRQKRWIFTRQKTGTFWAIMANFYPRRAKEALKEDRIWSATIQTWARLKNGYRSLAGEQAYVFEQNTRHTSS